MSVQIVFFFNDTATTEIYTLSLHDALPIYTDVGDERREGRPVLADDGEGAGPGPALPQRPHDVLAVFPPGLRDGDRKSTRLNSSHANISYAVFCLKKKQRTAN